LRNEESRLLTKYYYSDQVEDNEMNGTCNTCRGRTEMQAVFRRLSLNERDDLENLVVDAGILLGWVIRNGMRRRALLYSSPGSS
jgi:hypothetical protein